MLDVECQPAGNSGVGDAGAGVALGEEGAKAEAAADEAPGVCNGDGLAEVEGASPVHPASAAANAKAVKSCRDIARLHAGVASRFGPLGRAGGCGQP
jgi:hypothetical protein